MNKKLNITINFVFIVFLYHLRFISVVQSADKATNLCDDPVINSADFLINGSVRLYKENYFWELKGLPDRKGFVLGPFKPWYQNFAPIHDNTSVVTCIHCNRKGFVYKFEGLKWWAWEPSGRQWKGGKEGEPFRYLNITQDSNSTGFEAVFHNGDKNNPMMIGMSGNRIFYYSTKGYYIEPAFDYDIKGYEKGRNGENFPTGVTAAFLFPMSEQNFVYFFKRDKYCFRQFQSDSGSQCDEWRDNRELFGCDNSEKTNTIKTSDSFEKEKEETEKKEEVNPTEPGSNGVQGLREALNPRNPSAPNQKSMAFHTGISFSLIVLICFLLKIFI